MARFCARRDSTGPLTQTRARYTHQPQARYIHQHRTRYIHQHRTRYTHQHRTRYTHQHRTRYTHQHRTATPTSTEPPRPRAPNRHAHQPLPKG